MPTLVRDGRRIHYVQTGAGPGVVLVPGLGTGARLFGTLPRRFARAGFTCVAVDPVGLEPSGPLPATGYDFDQAADDVLAVARELPRPVSLVGTSLGGKVALRAVARSDGAVSQLVLLCSSAVVTPRARRVYRMFELLSTAVDGHLFGELTAPFLFGDSFHSRHDAVVADILRSARPTDAARAFMQAQARALQHFDGAEDARRCILPALCIAGVEDTLTLPADVARTAALLRRGTYLELAGAGHSLLLESARAFDDVVAFLRHRDAEPA